ncbi:hypothetical protein HDE_07773 [Halotydeus destructor]|nr:hypothetical protein HDE_07773 [Halotydeus destructor]
MFLANLRAAILFVLVAHAISDEIKPFVAKLLSGNNVNLSSYLAERIRFSGQVQDFEIRSNWKGHLDTEETFASTLDGVTFSQITADKSQPRKVSLRSDIGELQLKSSGVIELSGERYPYQSKITLQGIRTLVILSAVNETDYKIESVQSSPLPTPVVFISSPNPNATIPSYIRARVRLTIADTLNKRIPELIDGAWLSYWTS